jgi:hypothetical protein
MVVLALIALATCLGIVEGLQAEEGLHIQGDARRYYRKFHHNFLISDDELYAPRKLTYQEILSGKYWCAIKYKYLRDVKAKDFQPNWTKRLVELGASQTSAKQFVAMLPDSVKTGQVLELEWRPNVGLTIRFKNQVAGTLNDMGAFQAAFNSVIGPCAPEGVPEGLIGRRPDKQQPDGQQPCRNEA